MIILNFLPFLFPAAGPSAAFSELVAEDAAEQERARRKKEGEKDELVGIGLDVIVGRRNKRERGVRLDMMRGRWVSCVGWDGAVEVRADLSDEDAGNKQCCHGFVESNFMFARDRHFCQLLSCERV